MKDLQASLTKYGSATKSQDLGEWDVAVGAEHTIYLTNPNKYAKADLHGLKNADKRLEMNIPSEIGPGQTVGVTIKIAAKTFTDDAEEEEFFKNVFDKLAGKVVWRPA